MMTRQEVGLEGGWGLARASGSGVFLAGLRGSLSVGRMAVGSEGESGAFLLAASLLESGPPHPAELLAGSSAACISPGARCTRLLTPVPRSEVVNVS